MRRAAARPRARPPPARPTPPRAVRGRVRTAPRRSRRTANRAAGAPRAASRAVPARARRACRRGTEPCRTGLPLRRRAAVGLEADGHGRPKLRRHIQRRRRLPARPDRLQRQARQRRGGRLAQPGARGRPEQRELPPHRHQGGRLAGLPDGRRLVVHAQAGRPGRPRAQPRLPRRRPARLRDHDHLQGGRLGRGGVPPTEGHRFRVIPGEGLTFRGARTAEVRRPTRCAR